MARETVSFNRQGIDKLPDNKPVVYRILTESGKNNHTGVAQRGRVQDRVAEHLGSDRKSTRLNSSHEWISYAVFCLKKKTTKHRHGPHAAAFADDVDDHSAALALLQVPEGQVDQLVAAQAAADQQRQVCRPRTRSTS